MLGLSGPRSCSAAILSYISTIDKSIFVFRGRKFIGRRATIAPRYRAPPPLFGADGWELAWAYGDHHSDRAMLAAAKSAYAVTPDRPLTRTANAQGYDILEW